MALTAGYDYDIFISYATIDDAEPVNDLQLGWISAFRQTLERVLSSRLGAQPVIYWDRRNLQANHELEELSRTVRKSALFLAIFSPSYAKHEWTRKELAEFTESMPDNRRLFVAEYLPLDEGERYPPPIDGRKRARFWDMDEVTSFTAIPLSPGGQAFRQRIHDLADQMKKQLVTINAAEGTRPGIRQAAEVIANDSGREAKGIVYLAQTTEYLDEQRLEVERTLDQLGYLVLPSVNLPGGGEAFCAAAEAEIRRADLYVHLLGARGGRYPADLPDGYGTAQVALARRAGTDLLLWRHPELDVDSVKDARQHVLLTHTAMMVCGLEALKAEIRRRLEARHGNGPPPQALPRVFINATQNDYDVAKIVEQEFNARDMPTVLPFYQGSAKMVAQDILDNMRDCQVMLFIYGEAPPSWVRKQLLQFIKQTGTGAPKRLVALCIGPPEEKPKDLGVSVPRLRRVEFHGGWSPGPIRDLIAELAG